MCTSCAAKNETPRQLFSKANIIGKKDCPSPAPTEKEPAESWKQRGRLRGRQTYLLNPSASTLFFRQNVSSSSSSGIRDIRRSSITRQEKQFEKSNAHSGLHTRSRAESSSQTNDQTQTHTQAHTSTLYVSGAEAQHAPTCREVERDDFALDGGCRDIVLGRVLEDRPEKCLKRHLDSACSRRALRSCLSVTYPRTGATTGHRFKVGGLLSRCYCCAVQESLDCPQDSEGVCSTQRGVRVRKGNEK